MESPTLGRRERRTPLRPVAAALAVQLAITAVTTGVKLRSGRDDADLYFLYATQIRAGKVPYRDFRVEYPPLALPLFLGPALVAGDVASFKVVFGIEMLVFNAATVWLVASWVARARGPDRVRWALARYTALYLLLSRLVVLRFDAAAMCLGFGAAAWWFAGAPALGGVAAGLGALMKVYPGVIAVLAAPREIWPTGQPRGRGLAAFSLTVAVGVIAWIWVGGIRGMRESLDYQLGRGFEYGSLYSGLQMLAARMMGAEIAVVRDRAAWASVTPWTDRILPMVLPVQVATLGALSWISFRRRGNEGVRYSGAAILAFIVTGKVFSPQYLIWLLPFIAVLDGPVGRRAFWLFAAGGAVTLIAPALTGWYPRTATPVILAYNVKNAVFILLLGLLAFGPEAGERPVGT